jgi:molybdenum cofactor cytidylyltransferase
MFVTGLVLAAGGSRRLGVPKQVLAYRGGTLLGATLNRARDCGFDQLIVTLGGASAQVHEQVDLHGIEVVENQDFGTGCSSSIVAAVGVVDPRAAGIVLLLGDQPGVTAAAVWSLVAEVGGPATPIGVSRYDDGLGHPLWLGRELFGELQGLHGDKGVWKLIESGRYLVTEVDAIGKAPLDVNDWEDYQALLAEYEPGHTDSDVSVKGAG